MSTTSNRYIPLFVGGVNVYGNYISNDLMVTVQHVDKQTGTRLKADETVKAAYYDLVNAKSGTFDKYSYMYNVISEDGGTTWKEKSEETERNLAATKDTIIRFYYTDEALIIADLEMSASLGAIKTMSLKRDSTRYLFSTSYGNYLVAFQYISIPYMHCPCFYFGD